jgi:dipeptidase E
LPEPTIFAMGGGGFTMEPQNPALDDFVLALAPAPVPRICLLPTASGDGEAQIRQFHATISARLCEPAHVALFRLGRNPAPLRERLLAQDVIYVGGGSMVGLLAVWRALRLDRVLRECWERGVVLDELSAGAMCWFEWGVSAGVGRPEPAEGLGFLPGSFSVHADGEPAREEVLAPRCLRHQLPARPPADIEEFRRVAQRRRSA